MMSTNGGPKIALVHDELIRRGGAEIVFEELLKLFPEADVFSLYAGNPYISVNGQRKKITTTFLQKLPRWFRKHPSRMLPLLPQAAEQLDLSDYDLVLSSASAFAKGIVTRSNVPHVCYCHTPTRYVWDAAHELKRMSPWILQWPLAILMHYLRMVDFAAAQRVDVWIANSQYTRRRIATYYKRESSVVYPPIDTDFFTPSASLSGANKYTSPALRKEAPFIVVGRLSPLKHFEEAIAVCEKLGYPLIVIGRGRMLDAWKQRAGKHTTFVSKVSREQLREYYRSARAIIQPGVEDFGMATAEALACGTPVIARRAGGVQEIVRSGRDGILYEGSGTEALAEGVRLFLQVEHRFHPWKLHQQAWRFRVALFQAAIKSHIAAVLEMRNT